jgi:UrcA family protein
MCAKVAVTRPQTPWGQHRWPHAIRRNVSAKEKIVTDSVRVSPQGLDLSQPADSRTFYVRLENAAWIVCTRGTRVGLLPADSQFKCYQNALGDAVHASNKSMVTQIYLATHTVQEAAAQESTCLHKSRRSDLSRTKVITTRRTPT